jgi:hypothetical protein
MYGDPNLTFFLTSGKWSKTLKPAFLHDSFAFSITFVKFPHFESIAYGIYARR